MSKNDKSKELVPRLRFPEFRESEAWLPTTLEDVLDYEQPTPYIVESDSYLEDGTPVLTANKSFVLGFTDENEGIYDNVPAVIFDDFTTDAKFVNFPFKVKSSAIKILTKKRNDDELPLVFELLRRIPFDPIQHKRYYISEYQHLAIPLPGPTEQRKIAECLGSLDDWIAAETDALAALRRHKTGLMQQLFPRPGETRPRLRFPEFRDAPFWDIERLGSCGDFLSSLTGKTAADFDTGDATFVPYMNVFSNTFTDVENLRAVDVAECETQNAVSRGDVFFTVSSETQEDAGMSSVLLSDIANCYLNSFCALFRFHNGRSPDPQFLGYSLRSAVVRQHLARGAQGAIRYNISKGVFRDVPLLLPDPAEQRAIAECMGSLDDWIAAETDTLAALRRHKSGLMQQLFPAPAERAGRAP